MIFPKSGRMNDARTQLAGRYGQLKRTSIYHTLLLTVRRREGAEVNFGGTPFKVC